MAEIAGAITLTNFVATARGQCANGIAQAIIDLDLDGIGTNVWIRKMPNPEGIATPAVLIVDLPPRYSAQDGGVSRADVVYRFGVITMSAGNRETAWTDDSARVLIWDQAICKLFAKHARPFSFSGSVQSAGFQLLSLDIEPAEPVEAQHWRENYDCTVMALAAKVRFPNAN